MIDGNQRGLQVNELSGADIGRQSFEAVGSNDIRHSEETRQSDVQWAVQVFWQVFDNTAEL